MTWPSASMTGKDRFMSVLRGRPGDEIQRLLIFYYRPVVSVNTMANPNRKDTLRKCPDGATWGG
jgi:hypothetical protein